MTSGANEAGAISTLGAGETRLNRLINAQNGGVPSHISYPARPIQGGKLDRAPKKIGLWYAQPKYNGMEGGDPTNSDNLRVWLRQWFPWRITGTQFAVLFCPGERLPG